VLPEFNLNNIKLKVSTDNVSLWFSYLIIITVMGYYFLTKSWQTTSPVGFFIILGLIVFQIILLKLPQTKDLEYINSGGITPLVIYNASLIVNLIWYVPLYSPFILIIPPIMFITVYYRGLLAAIYSIVQLIFIVIVATHFQGLPHVPYAQYFPYALILLGTAFAGLVMRAGQIENGIRIELGRVASHVSGERQQLATLINSIGDAVVATDKAGNILFYNAAALGLFNTQVVTIGQPFSTMAKLYDRDGKRIDLNKLVANQVGRTEFVNFHILPKDNETEHIDLAIDVSRIEPDRNSKQASGFIYLMRDITKEKTLDEERDEFISVTSHELRTPITLVEADISIAMLDQEGVPPLPKVVKDRLEKAHEGIVYLANLTNQLITLSEAEKNQLEIISAPLELKDIIAEMEDKYTDMAKKKKLKFTTKIAASLPALNTSKIYLSEILDNLLSNAIKYTEKGTITLMANLSEDRKSIVISVKDTGIGISVSDKPKLFGKFYRSEDFHTRETGGAGLGLYMSGKLATYLRAKIWFDSDLGKGSTFYIGIEL
jgi:signal transduction histidine kinase